ncbi:MAG: hypothetical protein ACK45B_03035 [Limisphaerales bacterium]
MSRLLLTVLAALVVWLTGLPSATAATNTDTAVSDGSPQIVHAGIYMLNVGKFDLSSGSYTMDFYLSLRSDRPIADGAFEFMNGRATSMDKLIDEPGHKFYRVQASLYQNISLKEYPFDSHRLGIQIENKTQDARQMVFEVDRANSGIDPEVTIVGWDLTGWDARVEAHRYDLFGETFSKLVFEVNVRRIVLTAILKAFLPAIFIVLVGLLSLLLRPDKFAPRLGLNTSTLLGAVMFHLTVTSQIPPVGYLTLADKFMILSYLVLMACLFSTILLMRHTDKQEEELALHIYRRALTWIPLAALALYTALFALR